LEDFEEADAIFVIGQNPGTNHPSMLGDLRRAAIRGARVVVFKILQQHGTLAQTDRLTHGDAARLVAHVQAVGKIVG
ncbi:molybdopterin-dependent oxidoreductase, partial [Rhizobium ruizarguesonis]